MANLLLFIASDVTFCNIAQGEFQTEFAQSVHEMLLVRAISDFASFLESFGKSSTFSDCYLDRKMIRKGRRKITTLWAYSFLARHFTGAPLFWREMV